MEQDKLYFLRKSLVVLILILFLALVGIMLISTQVKTISLNYYGTNQTVITLADSVDSFLIQNKVYVEDDSNISPSLESKIENGMNINITSKTESAKIDLQSMQDNIQKITAKVEEVTEIIPYETEKSETALINRGLKTVIQEGTNGEKVIKYLIKYSGDKEIYRAELSSNINQEPQKEVIEVGTKIVNSVSRSSAVQSLDSIYLDDNFKLYNINLSAENQKYAYSLCMQYGIEYELFLAIMYKESGYNVNALGGGNSYGLCQIHVSNHANLRAKLGVSDFFDPYDNMTAGAYLLSHYFSAARARVSSPEDIEVYALNAYNMGDGVYYQTCFSQGILHRSYSTTVRNIRDRLKANGGL